MPYKDPIKRAECMRKAHALYYEKNKASIQANRALRYKASDKTKRNDRLRKKRLEDPSFKLAENLRGRLAKAIRGSYKSGSAVNDLGCSVQEFKDYLQARFEPGMTWEKWSRTGWHIDHIIPLAAFDLTDREQLLRACHYTNLQPMWAQENQIKGAR